MVIAAALDLTLRERFNTSLDEYMRALWRDYGQYQSSSGTPERPYTIADLRNELGKVAKDPQFANDFFRRYVDGQEVPDFAALFAPAGFRFSQDSVTKPFFGAATDSVAGGVVINWASEVGSAYTAGLSDGDIVIAVDGEAATSAGVLNAIISRHRVGDVVRLEVLQKGVVPSTVSIALKGLPHFKLETFESVGLPVTDAMSVLRIRWLSSHIAR